jgi:hypothetical protein
MLLYTHAVNESRTQTINSVWCWGAWDGAALANKPRFTCETGPWYTQFCKSGVEPLEVITTFQTEAYDQAFAALNARLERGFQSLTLCGPERYITLAPKPRGILGRVFSKAQASVEDLIASL